MLETFTIVVIFLLYLCVTSSLLASCSVAVLYGFGVYFPQVGIPLILILGLQLYNINRRLKCRTDLVLKSQALLMDHLKASEAKTHRLMRCSTNFISKSKTPSFEVYCDSEKIPHETLNNVLEA